VFLVARIEVAAGRGERRLALAGLVDVEGVLAGRDAFKRQPDQNTVRCLGKLCAADLLAFGVLQGRLAALRAGGRAQCKQGNHTRNK
jgi:hypothetical protein